MRRGIGLVAGSLLVAGGIVAAWLMWSIRRPSPSDITADLSATAPDGMYRCRVREQYTMGDCRTHVELFRRAERTQRPAAGGEGEWERMGGADVANDSVRRSNYCIDWEYDRAHRTTGVVVFGDFGSPPFDGKVIFSMKVPSSRPGK